MFTFYFIYLYSFFQIFTLCTVVNRLYIMVNKLFIIINQFYIIVSNLYTIINQLFTEKMLFLLIISKVDIKLRKNYTNVP